MSHDQHCDHMTAPSLRTCPEADSNMKIVFALFACFACSSTAQNVVRMQQEESGQYYRCVCRSDVG